MKTLTRWTHPIFEYFISSISKKIIIPYALLTLALAVFGVFVVTRLVAGSFEARLKNQLVEAGQVVSDETVNRERFRLEVQRSVANTVGVPEAIVERDLDRLEGLTSPLIANLQNVDSIVLLDTQGKELLRLQRKDSTPDAPIQVFKGSGVSFFNWEAVEKVLADSQGQTKDVQLARDPQGRLIIYTVGPVRTTEGTVGSALVGTYLQKEITLLHNMALAEITLFDESGTVMATTFSLDQDEFDRVFNFFTPIRYRQVIEQQNITLLNQVGWIDEMDNRGQMFRLAYTPFLLRDRISGVYGVALPTNFITDTNNISRNRLAMVFSVGVVAVFLVGYVVSRRIITPIIQLVQTSRAITEGDLSRRTELDSRDEIGILAKTFDHMTAELQRLLKIQQEEASKLNAILNSIADGVVVQDVAGKIVVMNPAAKQILEKMEIGEFSLSASARTADQDNAHDMPFGHVLADLTGLEFHETQRFEMGQQVLSALSAPVITPDQQQSGAVVVLRDITREVESEKLKDDFITSISHELRTPLTAIKGYNDLLRMTGGGSLNEQQLQFIRIVDDNVADLLNLIQEMLDLSQIDAGALGIDDMPVNLSELVETETGNWQNSMREHGLSFSVSLPPKPIWVAGDSLRLTRVLHNLLSNAQAYTLFGGQVSVLLKQVDDVAQVDVIDSGVGIAEEDQRFLFARFFRAIHNESTYDISGAGLGLYLSKAIIEAHHGEIWVKTELNKGSTFSFKLNLLKSPPAPPVKTEILENEKVESRN